MSRCVSRWELDSAYNDYHDDNIPGSVDHIHLPADVSEADRHDEDEDEPGGD